MKMITLCPDEEMSYLIYAQRIVDTPNYRHKTSPSQAADVLHTILCVCL